MQIAITAKYTDLLVEIVFAKKYVVILEKRINTIP